MLKLQREKFKATLGKDIEQIAGECPPRLKKCPNNPRHILLRPVLIKGLTWATPKERIARWSQKASALLIESFRFADCVV